MNQVIFGVGYPPTEVQFKFKVSPSLYRRRRPLMTRPFSSNIWTIGTFILGFRPTLSCPEPVFVSNVGFILTSQVNVPSAANDVRSISTESVVDPGT